ncbi:uncharacterized protein G2W53_018121 [Senna tora]|uniref:Uncharacterized protein n=1 Tax=Senna tora TaxID=362788 RepID=A0A834WL29_9FABA|nr:uncharacterized protein G2W53_018121 [Senna tora]
MENAGSTHHHRCRSVCISALHSSTHRHLGSISAMVKIDFVALSHCWGISLYCEGGDTNMKARRKKEHQRKQSSGSTRLNPSQTSLFQTMAEVVNGAAEMVSPACLLRKATSSTLTFGKWKLIGESKKNVWIAAIWRILQPCYGFHEDGLKNGHKQPNIGKLFLCAFDAVGSSFSS